MKKPILSFIVSVLGLASSQAALTLLPDPVSSSASTSFAGDTVNWGPQWLYDASPTVADIGTNYGAGSAAQYAGDGAGPHVLVFDYGSPVSFNGFAYAQRLGADPVADKVQNIDIWVTDTDPGAASLALPGILGAPQGNTGLLDTTPGMTLFNNYAIGDLTGRWVIFRLNDGGGAVFNPGGSELQLTIPEPTSGLLGIFGMLLILRRRR